MAVEKDVYKVAESFDKKDYTREPFPSGEYEDCRFVNCNFEKLDLTGIKFIQCEFVGCNLSISTLLNTSLGDVFFKDCKMLGLHFEQCNNFGFHVRFENCNLEHSSFYQVNLKNTSFVASALKEVDFTQAILAGSLFNECDLKDAKFEGTDLRKVDFRTAINFSIDPETNKVTNAKFSSTTVGGLLDKYNIEIN